MLQIIKGLLATLYLFFHPGTWKEIHDGMNEPLADSTPFENVDWQ